MSEYDLPKEGGCRCGQVRIKITALPIMTMACHCTGCQRMTASAFSLTAMIPSNAVEIVKGEPAIGGLHGVHRQLYCPHCKSWLLTRPHGFDHIVNVRPTMLDDLSYCTPFIETYTAEKLPWVKTPARHSYETHPQMEEYASLIQEFAEHLEKQRAAK